MKLHYDAETDSLYIDLASAPSEESREMSENLVIDFDKAGRIVGLDIQHASTFLDLSRVDVEHLPLLAVA